MKTDKKFWIVILIIVLIWVSLFWFMIKYAKYVRNDPCSVCAEKHGEQVFCALGGEKLFTRIYFPSGRIEEQEGFTRELSNISIEFRDT